MHFIVNACWRPKRNVVFCRLCILMYVASIFVCRCAQKRSNFLYIDLRMLTQSQPRPKTNLGRKQRKLSIKKEITFIYFMNERRSECFISRYLIHLIQMNNFHKKTNELAANSNKAITIRDTNKRPFHFLSFSWS